MCAARSADPGELGRVGVFSPGIRRIPHLSSFLGAERIVFRPDLSRRRVDTVVGWGRKENTRRARDWALRHGARYVMLEDGFVRSVGLGRGGDPPLSMVVDDVGIYYDATAASRLEQLVEGGSFDDATLARARACIETIREHRISKYNDAPVELLPETDRPRVLVVDQTAGDLSLRLGALAPDAFGGMLHAALDEHPDAEVIVKTHPDVTAGHRRGHFTTSRDTERVRYLTDRRNPIALLEQVDHVYVATSLLGLEALMLEKPVVCFGVPFYAGWGLTDDRAAVPRRRSARRTLEEVFAAAYLEYTRYVDPETGERCELERVLEHLALQRDMAERNRGTIYAIGFSVWKQKFIPAFVASPYNRVVFRKSTRDAEAHGLARDAKLLVWGGRPKPAVVALARRRSIPLWRTEDGFLRSVGLGSDLVMPSSLVVDSRGIYYDPTVPSDLEHILENDPFSPAELMRAALLRAAIVERGISKYNVGGAVSVRDVPRDGRRVVLVVGQVEDDASIELGCPGIRTNAALLREARRARPDAYVIFKPHPDVVSGNRKGAVDAREAARLADRVVEEASLPECLAVADEVHTLTSLVGFEALLRELPVVVYGQPFYAGWGLTDDRHPHPRRTRRLMLDELVAGTLIRYARYVSPRTRTFTTPESAVRFLDEARTQQGAARGIRAAWPARGLKKAVNLVRGLLDAP